MGTQKNKSGGETVSEVLNQHRSRRSSGSLDLVTQFGKCVFALEHGRVVHVNADESSETTDVEALFASPCTSVNFVPIAAGAPKKRTLLFTSDPAADAGELAGARTIRISSQDLRDMQARVAAAKRDREDAARGAPLPSNDVISDSPGAASEPQSKRTVLGRYEVLSRIATGGLGSVFLCRATGAHGFERLVALKVLRTDISRETSAIQALRHEAKIGGLASHPSLIRAIDFGEHEQQPYLVMDCVEGITVALMARHGALPAPVAVKLLLDALGGLSALHRITLENGAPLGAVHCDISPQNLLVGTDGVCRVIDYGSARSRLLRSDILHTEGRSGIPPEKWTVETMLLSC